MPQQKIIDLMGVIHAHLINTPGGFREYDLLRALDGDGHDQFSFDSMNNRLSMFQSHFLLFHCLYRLRDHVRGNQEADLNIDCLQIRLKPYKTEVEGLTLLDPLREYYLDLSQLEKTTVEDVSSLLDGFWQRSHAGQERESALRQLGLTSPVDYPQIKREYRRLVAENHPDRGGDTTRLQAINNAMDVLKTYYSPLL